MKLYNLKVAVSSESPADFYVFEEIEMPHTRALFVLHTNPELDSFTKIKFAEVERDFYEGIAAVREDLLNSLYREGYSTLKAEEEEKHLKAFPNVLKTVGLVKLQDKPLEDEEKQLAAQLYNWQPYRKIKV